VKCDENVCNENGTIHLLRVKDRYRIEERCVCIKHANLLISQYKALESMKIGIHKEHSQKVQYDIDFIFYDEARPLEEGGGGWIYLRDIISRKYIAFQTGYCELTALRQALTRSLSPRPLTYPLIKMIVETLGGKVASVQIDKYVEPGHVFYANISISIQEKLEIIDSRPSDAIILAVLCDVPIYVHNDIIKQYKEDGIK
jgi:uncharacterized protein